MHAPVMTGRVKVVARLAATRRNGEIIRRDHEFVSIEAPPSVIIVEMDRGVGSLQISMTKVAISQRKVPRHVEAWQGA